MKNSYDLRLLHLLFYAETMLHEPSMESCGSPGTKLDNISWKIDGYKKLRSIAIVV